MGIVHLFAERKVDPSKSAAGAANNNNETAEVVELIVNARIANGVPAKAIYKQMEAMLVNNGVNFSCDKNKSDMKILSYIVQGMFDRQEGNSSNRSLLGEALRYAMTEETPVPDDTDALFGDLLGKL